MHFDEHGQYLLRYITIYNTNCVGKKDTYNEIDNLMLRDEELMSSC